MSKQKKKVNKRKNKNIPSASETQQVIGIQRTANGDFLFSLPEFAESNGTFQLKHKKRHIMTVSIRTIQVVANKGKANETIENKLIIDVGRHDIHLEKFDALLSIATPDHSPHKILLDCSNINYLEIVANDVSIVDAIDFASLVVIVTATGDMSIQNNITYQKSMFVRAKSLINYNKILGGTFFSAELEETCSNCAITAEITAYDIEITNAVNFNIGSIYGRNKVLVNTLLDLSLFGRIYSYNIIINSLFTFGMGLTLPSLPKDFKSIFSWQSALSSVRILVNNLFPNVRTVCSLLLSAPGLIQQLYSLSQTLLTSELSYRNRAGLIKLIVALKDVAVSAYQAQGHYGDLFANNPRELLAKHWGESICQTMATLLLPKVYKDSLVETHVGITVSGNVYERNLYSKNAGVKAAADSYTSDSLFSHHNAGVEAAACKVSISAPTLTHSGIVQAGTAISDGLISLDASKILLQEGSELATHQIDVSAEVLTIQGSVAAVAGKVGPHLVNEQPFNSTISLEKNAVVDLKNVVLQAGNLDVVSGFFRQQGGETNISQELYIDAQATMVFKQGNVTANSIYNAGKLSIQDSASAVVCDDFTNQGDAKLQRSNLSVAKLFSSEKNASMSGNNVLVAAKDSAVSGSLKGVNFQLKTEETLLISEDANVHLSLRPLPSNATLNAIANQSLRAKQVLFRAGQLHLEGQEVCVNVDWRQFIRSIQFADKNLLNDYVTVTNGIVAKHHVEIGDRARLTLNRSSIKANSVTVKGAICGIAPQFDIQEALVINVDGKLGARKSLVVSAENFHHDGKITGVNLHLQVKETLLVGDTGKFNVYNSTTIARDLQLAGVFHDTGSATFNILDTFSTARTAELQGHSHQLDHRESLLVIAKHFYHDGKVIGNRPHFNIINTMVVEESGRLEIQDTTITARTLRFNGKLHDSGSARLNVAATTKIGKKAELHGQSLQLHTSDFINSGIFTFNGDVFIRADKLQNRGDLNAGGDMTLKANYHLTNVAFARITGKNINIDASLYVNVLGFLRAGNIRINSFLSAELLSITAGWNINKNNVLKLDAGVQLPNPFQLYAMFGSMDLNNAIMTSKIILANFPWSKPVMFAMDVASFAYTSSNNFGNLEGSLNQIKGALYEMLYERKIDHKKLSDLIPALVTMKDVLLSASNLASEVRQLIPKPKTESPPEVQQSPPEASPAARPSTSPIPSTTLKQHWENILKLTPQQWKEIFIKITRDTTVAFMGPKIISDSLFSYSAGLGTYSGSVYERGIHRVNARANPYGSASYQYSSDYVSATDHGVVNAYKQTFTGGSYYAKGKGKLLDQPTPNTQQDETKPTTSSWTEILFGKPILNVNVNHLEVSQDGFINNQRQTNIITQTTHLNAKATLGRDSSIYAAAELNVKENGDFSSKQAQSVRTGKLIVSGKLDDQCSPYEATVLSVEKTGDVTLDKTLYTGGSGKIQGGLNLKDCIIPLKQDAEFSQDAHGLFVGTDGETGKVAGVLAKNVNFNEAKFSVEGDAVIHAEDLLSATENTHFAHAEGAKTSTLHIEAKNENINGMRTDTTLLAVKIKNVRDEHALVYRQDAYENLQPTDVLSYTTTNSFSFNEPLNTQGSLVLTAADITVNERLHADKMLHLHSTEEGIVIKADTYASQQLSLESARAVELTDGASLLSDRLVKVEAKAHFSKERSAVESPGVVHIKAASIKQVGDGVDVDIEKGVVTEIYSQGGKHFKPEENGEFISELNTANFKIDEHSEATASRILGDEVYLEATQGNIENLGGSIRGKTFLQAQAEGKIINPCAELAQQSPHGDMFMKFKAGIMRGGNGIMLPTVTFINFSSEDIAQVKSLLSAAIQEHESQQVAAILDLFAKNPEYKQLQFSPEQIGKIKEILDQNGHESLSNALIQPELVGLYLWSNDKIQQSGSIIGSNAANHIFAKSGFESYAKVGASYVELDTLTRTHHNRDKITRTEMLPAIVFSSSGKTQIKVESGGVFATGTSFVAKDGTLIDAKKDVVLTEQSVVAYERYRDKEGCRGFQRTRRELSLARTGFVDLGKSEIISQQGNVETRALAVSSRDFTLAAPNGKIYLDVAIMNHEIRLKQAGFSIKTPIFSYDQNKGFDAGFHYTAAQLVPFFNNMNTLCQSKNNAEIAANLLNIGVEAGLLMQQASRSTNFGRDYAVSRLRITVTYSKTETTSRFQSIIGGGIHADRLTIIAGKSATINGVQVHTLNTKIITPEFNVRGVKLNSDTKVRAKSASLILGANGHYADVGGSYSQSKSKSENWQQAQFDVVDNLELDVDTFNVDAANVNVGTISGRADKINIISRQDKHSSSGFSVGASTDGQFDVGLHGQQSTKIAKTSGLHVQQGINHDETHQFSVGETHLQGASITSAGPNKLDPGLLIKTDIHDRENSYNIGLSANAAQLVSHSSSASSVMVSHGSKHYRATQHSSVGEQTQIGTRFDYEVLEDRQHQVSLNVPIVKATSQASATTTPSSEQPKAAVFNKETTSAPETQQTSESQFFQSVQTIQSASTQTKIPRARFNPETQNVRLGQKTGAGGTQQSFDLASGGYQSILGAIKSIQRKNAEAPFVESSHKIKTEHTLFNHKTQHRGGITQECTARLSAEIDLKTRQCAMVAKTEARIVGPSCRMNKPVGKCRVTLFVDSFEAAALGELAVKTDAKRGFNAHLKGELGVTGPMTGVRVQFPKIVFMGITIETRADCAVGVGVKAAAGAGATMDVTKAQVRTYTLFGGYAGVGATARSETVIGVDQKTIQDVRSNTDNLCQSLFKPSFDILERALATETDPRKRAQIQDVQIDLARQVADISARDASFHNFLKIEPASM